MPGKSTYLEFCEQEVNFHWGNVLRFRAVLEDSIVLMNTIHFCPVAVMCQASHTLSQTMLSGIGHYTSCPDDETEGQSGPGHPAMT